MRRHLRWLLWPALIAGLVWFALGGGFGDRPDAPPSDFGPRRGGLLGCPSMVATYLWPPVAGAHTEDARLRPRLSWADGVPLPAGREPLQIRVRERNGELRFEWRGIHTDARMRVGRTRDWGHAQVGPGRCRGGVLELEAPAMTGPDSLTIPPKRKRFRIARLEDGALAVGLPDRHHWTWSKLRLQVDGDAEPPVMEAAPAP